MSPACLYGEAKCTEIITTRLYDDILPGEELFSCNFSKRANFCHHHGFFFFWSDTEVIRIFGENFYILPIRGKLTIYLEKSWIHDSISDIATSREEEFFSFSDLWEHFFRMFDPFCFCLVRHDTRRDKISTLVRQVRVDEPLFREIFIGLATKYFEIQNRKINRVYLYRKISSRQILYTASISIRRLPISTSRIFTRRDWPMIYTVIHFVSMRAPILLSSRSCTLFTAPLPI